MSPPLSNQFIDHLDEIISTAKDPRSDMFGNYLLTRRYGSGNTARYTVWADTDAAQVPQRSGTPGLRAGFMNIIHGKVVGMATTSADRIIAPIMLGVAHNWHQGLTPSDDLSKHSLRMVSGLARRGLVSPEHVLDEPTNQTEFLGEHWSHRHPREFNVTREEVNAGRHTMRQMLRQARHIG